MALFIEIVKYSNIILIFRLKNKKYVLICYPIFRCFSAGADTEILKI